MSLATTAAPQARASITGSPNPSASLGTRTAAARRYTSASSARRQPAHVDDRPGQPEPGDPAALLGRPLAADLHQPQVGDRLPDRRDHVEQHVHPLPRDATADVEHPGPAAELGEPRQPDRGSRWSGGELGGRPRRGRGPAGRGRPIRPGGSALRRRPCCGTRPPPSAARSGSGGPGRGTTAAAGRRPGRAGSGRRPGRGSRRRPGRPAGRGRAGRRCGRRRGRVSKSAAHRRAWRGKWTNRLSNRSALNAAFRRPTAGSRVASRRKGGQRRVACHGERTRPGRWARSMSPHKSMLGHPSSGKSVRMARLAWSQRFPHEVRPPEPAQAWSLCR